MMAGKTSIFTSRRLFYAMHGLSKNALIDLIVDRVRAEVGENATDEQVTETVEKWMGPVARERGDEPISLGGLMAKWDKSLEDYVNRTGRYKQV